ncbi:PLP-dependent aminotransferase family protein [Pseudonocardia lacus]|uniref:MocR-like pyridoxine biosynthesis transcription factor PdxR n=1 Tax=Pseudonocardia lacus TaxID=2835865 RepID=UPI001BDC56C5|nr:PLP-dependent aminotransferase family protein [Pseudonocardia lacus]
MGTSAPELFLAFDRTRRRGLRAQIEGELRSAIRTGRLAPGATVPSTRALAGDLGVTRRVVIEAYDQLVAEGYLLSRPGAGTTVNRVPPVTAPARRPGPAPDPVRVDFRPGRPDLDLFPRAAWARASREALRTLRGADLADDDPRGLPVLRAALAEHLGRVRGVGADPEHIVVCGGFGHALDLVAHALPDRTFAVEDPGYPGPRRRLTGFVPVGVDGDGLVVDELRRTPARAVVVTPAHQSPTGVALSPARRNQLVEWARDVDGHIVEDDYDAEYRYDRRPVGALHGLAPQRVVHCGTTSKTLASGVRLGWAVVPPPLMDAVLARRATTDGATSSLLQAAFAALLTSGDLDRHLRRSRRVYQQRRDAVLAGLGEHLPEAAPSGIAAGLSVLLTAAAGHRRAGRRRPRPAPGGAGLAAGAVPGAPRRPPRARARLRHGAARPGGPRDPAARRGPAHDPATNDADARHRRNPRAARHVLRGGRREDGRGSQRGRAPHGRLGRCPTGCARPC